jgi:molybdate transport system substrate-binding protein
VNQSAGVRLLSVLGLVAFSAASPAAQPEPVQIFAAGSLRGVVTELAAEAGAALGIAVQPRFGGSGTMR